MIRLSLTAAVAAMLAFPVAAHAQTGLSAADQSRVVCVPKRDKAGNKIDGQVCMTGAQWQKALANARVPAKYQNANWIRSSGTIATSNYYRPSAFLANSASRSPFPGRATR